ncbi:hypothetical protein [Paenibacillus sp. SI8]|uniref:hypothetical protein n=1 Tax=unclassified Paenibacillus TaxID=185978 RepID=UPI003465EE20
MAIPKIDRKTVSGTGNGTADATGYPYARVFVDKGAITVNSSNGSSWVCDGERISGGVILNVRDAMSGSPFAASWRIEMQKTIPNVNQSVLIMNMSESGLTISGDDNVYFRGQDVDPATVDITGMPINLEALGKLFNRALVERPVDDPNGVKIAAKYCKLKDAILNADAFKPKS